MAFPEAAGQTLGYKLNLWAMATKYRGQVNVGDPWVFKILEILP